MLYDATGKFGVGIAIPCDPPVSDRRLNASCCPRKSSVIVTIANVAARVR